MRRSANSQPNNSTTCGLALAGLALILMCLPAAAIGAGRHSRTPWWQVEDNVKTLGLTADQVSQIAEVEAQFAEPLHEARKARIAAYRKLIRKMDSTTYTAEEIKALTKGLEDAFSAEVRVSVSHWKELRGILNDAQWVQLPTVAPGDLMVGGFGISARGKVIIGEPRSAAGAVGPAATKGTTDAVGSKKK